VDATTNVLEQIHVALAAVDLHWKVMLSAVSASVIRHNYGMGSRFVPATIHVRRVHEGPSVRREVKPTLPSWNSHVVD
jgi:hypothetical protein